MFNLVCESSTDEALLIEGMRLVNALTFCLQEFHLLDDVTEVLVVLPVAVDVGENAPPSC